MIKYLNFSLLIPAFLLMSLRMTAQDQQYYLYIQSERSQPFYVRFDGKVLSSSDKGYLILSKLPAGTASMRIGFAKGEIPEHLYKVKVGGPSDQGYLLKADGLYNIISYATIRPVKNGDVAEAEPASKLTGTPPEPVAAAVAVQETPAPVEPAPAPAGEPQKAMMDSMQKDLAAAFPNNDGGITVSPGTRPVKQPSKFSDALDKVVKDDRPEEPLVDPNAGTGMTLAPKADSAAARQPEERKGRKKRRDRDPLTVEEQQILADVMAEEQKSSEPAAAPATEVPAVAAAPAEETPAPVEETPVPEKKAKKKKKANPDEPSFIDFQDGSKAAATTAAAAVAEPVAVAVEEPVKTSKKKKRKSEEVAESQHNVLTDSTGYAVTDLSIDRPRESKKDRKKKKQEAGEGGEVAVPVVAAADVPAPAVDNKSSLKMINSDCGKVMDDDTFRKVLRKYVAGKDDDGMIDAFKKQTKGYCLETSQIKTLVQLLGTDDSRYRLLDSAYPKAYDSEKFASLENTLSDSYFKGRFRAMLHR
jgi:hypothetical protein